ncbi:MAG: leucine-rich repeat protein [Bacteroidaceae bacterium]|nr:leucine-rich repeat protein [Bacteroidaceae bacterium]
MKKIINICLLWMCQLALFGQARIGDNPDYNPTNPGDPQVPVITKTYGLSTVVSPVGAGSTNFSGTTQYAEGKSVNVRAYSNTGYQFVNWVLGDSVVSTSASFNYTMPAKNVTLTAVFKYNPSSPADPDSLGLKYDLTVVASPKQGGSFNVSSTEVQEGHSTNLYAYPNTGFRFKGWQLDGEIVSTASPYKYTMGDKDVTITGVFEYNPSNPSNPGKNSWNKATGEVIADDFTAGSLYNAINQVTGGENSSVTLITVSGKMSSNDFGIANNFSNCTMVDLKRSYGYTDVPDYAYDYNTALTSIILPASIENIGYRAFYQASNLADVTCYAITPPTVESYAFDGLAEGAVLHVLSAAIPLYAEAEGWKDFTILPLTEEVQALEVNLPADSEDGRYKNMTLELINAESGQKQKYVISDRVSYTFNGLLKKSIFNVYVKNNMDVVLGKIENIAIEDKDVSVTFESLLQPQNITLSVRTPDGADVTSQTQIRWFDSTDGYLQQGNKLSGLLAGTAVRYRITLPQALGMQYVLPADSVYTIQEEGNVLVCTLQPLEEVTISGRVKDVTTGSALSGAVVSVSQKLNGLYSKAFTVKTDNKGEFVAKVFNDQSTITVSATDYLNQTLEFADFNDTTFVGEVALKGITGATIATSFTYRTSVEEGTVSEIQNWYSDYANVAYEIYNETQQRAITQFNVQYPNIVLLEEVAEGDALMLTALSRTNAFVPVTATATIDAQNRAEAVFDIVELGAIRAKFTSTDNASVVGILYDSKGQLMKKYTYGNASLSISNLADGDYTLVSMTNSSLFNSILNLSQFAASGLKEGTDYVQNTVTVKSGVVATISNDLIPVLDESKLYYTGDNTLFSVNKTSIVAGNYLTLKGKIDFKSAYSSKVSNVNMVVDLPESCSFVENSVMVGSNISSYTLDGCRLTIPLTGKYTDQVRFCVIPTAGGDYAPNAFAQFTLDNKEVLQPIGNAKFTVKDLTISVPSTVAKTTVPISGAALGNSVVEIYDNGILIGVTNSLANGMWTTTCELIGISNYSSHQIQAKVKTDNGLELLSEIKTVVFDKYAILPSKVTMINVAHPATSLELCEYVTEFDFIDPKENSAYWYWPNYPEFTFLVELTRNDTTLVKDVWVNVYTSNGDVTVLETEYNAKRDKWVANKKFYSDNLPVNVSVSINNLEYDISDTASYKIVMDDMLGDFNVKEDSLPTGEVLTTITDEKR